MHRILGVSLMILICTSLSAQRNGNSPYSRFGIGDISDLSFVHLRQMGSIGSSFVDNYQVNVNNPASYAFLKSTAFEIGMAANRSKLTENGTTSEPIWSGNLEYLSLAFPLQNDLNQLLDRKIKPYRFGMAFTLAPASNVAYNIESVTVDPDDGEIIRNYNGTGGSYKFLWGTGFKYKNFAVGTNLGYQFGNVTYERVVNFSDIQFAYDDIFKNQYSMNGFVFDLGTVYTIVLNKPKEDNQNSTPINSITFGLTYNNSTSLNTTAEISQLAIQSETNSIDTAFLSKGVEGQAKLPSAIGIGASYRKGNSFMIGVDYKATNWNQYFNEATDEVKETLKNTSTMSVGGYYRPNYKSYTSYWNRVYYRFGAYTKGDPREIDGTQLRTSAVTLGLGLPFVFKRKVSHANLGFEIGKRGAGTPISETFCRFSVGFTFNDDEWFLKRKYN